MNMGIRIGQYRRKLNITQEELARKLGVSNQAVSKWESDQCYPDIMLLPQLADIFSVSLDELFGRAAAAAPVVSECALPWPDDNTLHAVLFVGHTLQEDYADAKKIRVVLEGNPLNVDCRFDLSCDTVQGSVNAGGDVQCDAVGGFVNAGGDVTCDVVGAYVQAMGDVTCDTVGGFVNAGGDITCDTVEGDAKAGGDIQCDSVEGNATAGGDITCDTIEGNASAGGNIHMG